VNSKGGAIIEKEKFNQMEYINEFKRKNYRSYRFEVRKDNKRVIDKLDSTPNKTAYIIGLIEDDITRK